MLQARRADEKDSEAIFGWRNDESTRQMSHAIDLIDWDNHHQWFSSALKNQKRLLVICEDSSTSERIAIVRFDIKNDIANSK